MTKESIYRRSLALGVLVLGFFLPICESYAQRINFSLWTGSDDITITPVPGKATLNFNEKKPLITPNTPSISINFNDDQVAAFEIQAPEGFDITVEVDSPSLLTLDGGGGGTGKEIPLIIGMSYNNMEASTPEIAQQMAIQLPPNFFNVTFPVNRRMNGAPGPPPTPISGGDPPRPKSTAYLFIYGQLGPIGSVDAGQYLGDITINVFFTSND